MSNIESLSNEKQQLTARLLVINQELKAINEKGKPMQWTGRTLSCIKKHKKVMITTHIFEYLFRNEPHIISDLKLRTAAAGNVSIALQRLIKNKVLKAEKRPGLKGWVYGLPEWFDESGNVKQEYDVDFFDD